MSNSTNHRSSVSKSGPATASAGGYANTGVHIGDINLLTGAPVQTRYIRQVRRIASPRLLDREQELAELAEFCTSSTTAGAYRWWRASAWTGKSALMSWFVLHPPEGVRLVSFFVTARLADQNDRHAFIDNVMEQLLALLGETLPPFLTEATREAHLLELIEQAAEACRDRGETFVLLVDGLDEDRGAQSAYSIAGLLPAEPPAGMRVIVAGRPNPPVPEVDKHHPLRDPAIVRTLAASPHAEAIRQAMERDLQRLLDGTPAEQDLLGLVAGAGGGLSADDLADLTGLSRWQVENHLRTVSGRSFSVRASRYAPDVSPDVYLLGHEELQLTALEMLGPARVRGYRERLRAWFRHYREHGWPADTPEYLLRGYFNMVNATGDLAAMVECATDPGRQDRMLDLSGGDVTALTEIATAMDVAAQNPPDLIAMVRLAMHRDHLKTRNSRISATLPEVWALLGQFNRAEAMANSISDPDEHDHALSLVAVVMAEAGKLDQAETLVLPLTNLPAQVYAIPAIARAAAAADEPDRAIRLAHLASDAATDVFAHDDRAIPIALAAEAAAAAREFDRAVELLNHAASVSAPEYQPGSVVRAFVLVSAAMEADGATDRARDVFTRAWNMIDADKDPYRRVWVLASAAEAAVMADLPVASAFLAEAESAMSKIDSIYCDVQELSGLVKAMAAVGGLGRATALLDKAEAIALSESAPRWKAEAAVRVAEAAAAINERSRTGALIKRIVNLTATEHDAEWKCEITALAARAAAMTGDVRHASALAEQSAAIARAIFDIQSRATALASVAEAAAAIGYEAADRLLQRADDAAASIDHAADRLRALGQNTKTAAMLGHTDRVYKFAHQMEDFDFIDTFIPPDNRSPLFEWAIEALVMVGDSDHAAALLARGEQISIVDLDEESARDLIPLVKVAAAGGLITQAVGLADRVEALVPTLETEFQSEALAVVAQARAATGELARATSLLDRAEEIAYSIPYDWRDGILVSVAVAAGAVDVNRVGRIVKAIVDPYQQALALALTAECHPPARRTQLLAQALRLANWYLPVRPLVELVPEALPVIVTELETVQARDRA